MFNGFQRFSKKLFHMEIFIVIAYQMALVRIYSFKFLKNYIYFTFFKMWLLEHLKLHMWFTLNSYF